MRSFSALDGKIQKDKLEDAEWEKGEMRESKTRTLNLPIPHTAMLLLLEGEVSRLITIRSEVTEHRKPSL